MQRQKHLLQLLVCWVSFYQGVSAEGGSNGPLSVGHSTYKAECRGSPHTPETPPPRMQVTYGLLGLRFRWGSLRWCITIIRSVFVPPFVIRVPIIEIVVVIILRLFGRHGAPSFVKTKQVISQFRRNKIRQSISRVDEFVSGMGHLQTPRNQCEGLHLYTHATRQPTGNEAQTGSRCQRRPRCSHPSQYYLHISKISPK